MPFNPGVVILNKYRIEEQIGRGAFAEVYRATHLALSAPRALKILRKDAPGLGSTRFTDFHARFQLEAQLGARLDHPNVIRVHDFEQDGDTLILVMEYAQGGSLAERLTAARDRDEQISILEAIQVAIDVARGLSAIHALDAVHRDLKPSNILFDKQDHAKVADIGLVQIPGGPSMRSQLSTGVPHPGTPGYMSPEQESISNYLTPASDTYALGLVLFEILTGRVYRSQQLGTMASKLRADIPSWLDDLLERMLAKEVHHRPWDGNEAVILLKEGLEYEDLQQEIKEKSQHISKPQVKEEAVPNVEKDLEESNPITGDSSSRIGQAPTHMGLDKLSLDRKDSADWQKTPSQTQAEEKLVARHESDFKADQLAHLERNIRTALAEKKWGHANRLIGKLNRHGKKGQTAALRYRERIPKYRRPIGIWTIILILLGVFVIIGVTMLDFQARDRAKSMSITSSVTDVSISPSITLSVTRSPMTPSLTILSPTETLMLSATITSTPSIGSTLVSDTDGMTLVYIPEGEFEMGGSDDFKYLGHLVYLNAYWMDQTEVTNAMFAEFLNQQGNQVEGGTTWLDTGNENALIEQIGEDWQAKSGFENHPVIEVSWYGARAYCKWVGRRLPTEAEWEKAARGENGYIYPWGDEFYCNRGNFDDETIIDGDVIYQNEGCDSHSRTAQVGSFASGASTYKILDMAGNVWEWVADWYDMDYYNDSPSDNPIGPDLGNYRVRRGGSWSSTDWYVRTIYRNRLDPFITLDDQGFRCAMDVEP